ncbi:MAG: reverse transcriptase domain-containing protein, partial [Roseovarius sp.]
PANSLADDAEALQPGQRQGEATNTEVKGTTPKRHASITISRLIDGIGPTIGFPGIYCKACEDGVGKHSPGCRERFDKAYRDIADSDVGARIDGVTASEPTERASAPIDEARLDAMIADLGDYVDRQLSSAPRPPEPCCDFDAMVTRLLDRREALASPAALASIRKEADGLVDKGTWALETVQEKDEVIKQARRKKQKVHIGSLMTICSEKFAELEEQFRVLKGRVVYRGDSAKDEEGAAAVYQNLSASPTSIRAMNANIAYGRVPGNKTTSADAVKAYVQATLNSEFPTWVQIPKELQPEGWQYKRPVCRLMKALYGHPESGGHWERHLTKVIKGLGGEPVPEHPGSFWFPATRLLLTTYVDDFLLSGPAKHHASLWAALGDVKNGGIEIEDIGDLSRFLGRHHDVVLRSDGSEAVAFNMRDYVRAACERYMAIDGVKALKAATTPFCPEGSLTAADDEERGELASEACSVLMKDLWVARLARPDLTKAITALSSKVSKWTKNHDRMLHRLMCYMWGTREYELIGYVNDPLEELWLDLYVDADWAGDREDKYST